MKKIELYQDGTYFENNKDWHVQDSPWKAKHIEDILTKNKISPKTVVDVGCGVGEVLKQLSLKFKDAKCTGYEVSEQAFSLSKIREHEKLEFKLENLFIESNQESFDLLLAIDVFEHIEDYFDFLRKCKPKAKYKVFHIPLDMSVQMVLRMNPIIELRNRVGHIHYFSKETAIQTLLDTGYEIVDYCYTNSANDNPKSKMAKLMKLPRNILQFISPDFAARILGRYSLLVLAK